MHTAVLTSILPVCLLMVLGAALCRFRFLPDTFFAQMNRLGFWLLLPALLFCTILKAPASASATGLTVALMLCGSSVLVTGAGWLAARGLGLAEGSTRALMQAAMRGNLAYTALPVLIYALGEGSEGAAAAAFALAPTIPFYNVLAVVILTPAGGPKRGHLIRATLAVLRNPLIIGCLLGLLVRRSHVTMPAGLFNAVDALGRAALPCALLALGAGLTPERVRASFRPALAATILKLIAMPAIGYGLTLAAGVTGDMRLITLLYLASPCAITSYVMADQMGADKNLAGSAIVLSTLFCLPVMALILIVFGH